MYSHGVVYVGWAVLLLIASVSTAQAKLVAGDGKFYEYDVFHFHQRLSNVLSKAKVFLNKERSQNIVVADGEVQHRYEDKYLLVEQISRSMADALMASLMSLGLTEHHWKTIHSWASQNSSVVLRMVVEERCEFWKEEEKEDTVAKEVSQSSISTLSPFTTTKTTKYVYKEYIYNVKVHHKLEVRRGAGVSSNDVLTIWNIDRTLPFTTRQKSPPLPDVSNQEDVDIFWLVSMLHPSSFSKNGKSLSAVFQIDRSAAKTLTPVRNEFVERVLDESTALSIWVNGVAFHIKRWFDISAQASGRRHDFHQVTKIQKSIFVPVTAFMQQAVDSSATDSEGSHAILGMDIIYAFHEEQTRSLKEALDRLEGMFPPEAYSSGIVTTSETRVLVIVQHIEAIVRTYDVSLSYIELIMRKQLTAALGKEIGSSDIVQYMSYHYRKLYKPDFHPIPWTVSVRRSQNHSPEGSVRLDGTVNSPAGEPYQPIETFSRSFQVRRDMNATSAQVVPSSKHKVQGYDTESLMSFPINAATQVYFAGERHIHGWLAPVFETALNGNHLDNALRFVATAQQFSCYMVLLGRVASPTSFDPKYAFIIQNKEEISIPLSLDTIPNAQQFRDAIESLSPKQQRFARAYRAMQLESTLFGVVILQIKPQLEKVLNLYADSLTKEIALTRDLMELFIEYQIPTDLLSVDVSDLNKRIYSESSSTNMNNDSADSPQSRIKAVKDHVQQMKTMLQEMKEREIKERDMEKKYASERVSTSAQFQESAGSFESASYDSRMRTTGVMHAKMAFADHGIERQQQTHLANLDTADMLLFDAGSSPSSVNTQSATQFTSLDSSTLQSQSSENSSPPSHPSTSSASTLSSPLSTTGEGQPEFVKLPQLLDDAFDRLDSSRATRPATVRIGSEWTRERKKALLQTTTKHETLTGDLLTKEKTAAFELLDALTRSGSLVIEHAALHIVVVTTHSFTDSVMATVVEQNRNPIEDLERSSLVLLSTLHGVSSGKELLQNEQIVRVQQSGVGGRRYETSDVEKLLFGSSDKSNDSLTKV
jgi:hypothetical protein